MKTSTELKSDGERVEQAIRTGLEHARRGVQSREPEPDSGESVDEGQVERVLAARAGAK